MPDIRILRLTIVLIVYLSAPATAQTANEEFGSTDAGGCCETEECRAERIKELSRQRYETAKGCMESKTSPCPIEPELVIPALCPPEPKAAPPLEGKAESTTLEGGVKVDEPEKQDPPPPLKSRTPKPDISKAKPPKTEPDYQREKEVSAKILKKPPPNNSGGPADAPSPGDEIHRTKEVSAKILQKTELPGNPAAGGTVSNPITRTYVFLQGIRDGLLDGAQGTGEQMGHLMIATYYVLIGLRTEEAAKELRLIPGESVTMREFQEDIDGWAKVLSPDGSVTQSYESGRFIGKQLSEKVIGKYGDRFRDKLGVPKPPEVPPEAPQKKTPEKQSEGSW